MEESCKLIMDLSLLVGFLFSFVLIGFIYLMLKWKERTVKKRYDRIVNGIIKGLKEGKWKEKR